MRGILEKKHKWRNTVWIAVRFVNSLNKYLLNTIGFIKQTLRYNSKQVPGGENMVNLRWQSDFSGGVP